MESQVLPQTMRGPETSSNSLPSPIKRRGGGLMRLGTRRARAACALCRWKKVRCDAEEGHPCSNCNFEDVECVVLQKQRRKKTYTHPKPYKPPVKTNERLADWTPDLDGDGVPRGMVPQEEQPSAIMRTGSPPLLLSSPLDILDSSNSPRDDIDMDQVSAQSMPPSIASPRYPSTFSRIEKALTSSIPPYLRPPPQHMGSCDIEYLHRKGALLVPDPELRDALLRSYIAFIHPTLPLLDLHTFLASIDDPVQYGQLSLPLFQAVMFAGSAWVDIKLLRRLGFLTRKAARKSLYQKARLLYDADYEGDKFSLIQTLVLLTLWWESPNEQKDGWYWSGLSLLFARTVGLTRDSVDANVHPSMRRWRRRLWWSCLMRDTIASFGSQRPPRVEDQHFDVSMLSMDDFEIQEPESKETKWTVATSAAQQRQLAHICIEMAKLCRIISRILKAAYSEDTVGHIGTFFVNQEFNDKAKATTACKRVDTQKLSLCEEELRKWKDEVPEEVLHAHPTPSPTDPADQAPYLHRALLSLLYFTALLSLHRPLASSKKNCSKIRYAAAQGNEIVMDLYRADLMRLIPAAALSCLIPISISHVHDMRSPEETIRREGQRQLEECKQVLRELSDAHIAAEWAINFLSFVGSQVKQKEHKKLTGMMSGEIRWEMQDPQSMPVSSPNLTFSPEGNQGNGNDYPSNTPDTGNISAHTNDFIMQRATAPSNGVTKQANGSGQSPDDFSSLINFPEMWLGMAGGPGIMMDMDWIDQNQTPVILE